MSARGLILRPFAVLVTLGLPACEPLTPVDEGDADGDAPPVGQDAGAGEGALSDVSDDWKFEVTRAGQTDPELCCDVAIGRSAFEITCPTARNQGVGPGCTLLLEALHISGTLERGLSGTFDELVHYEGEGCAAIGLATGVPISEPAFAIMEAERTEVRPLGDFLRALGGRWSWQLRDVGDMVVDRDCQVDIGLAPGDGVALAVDITCPAGESFDISPACTGQDFAGLDLRLGLGGLGGELGAERHHEGIGCGPSYPPVVAGELAARLTATRGAYCPGP